MVSGKALRIGLVGCGGISNAHARGYRTLGPEVARVIATADVSLELAQRRAQELEASQASDDYHAVLNSKDVEAVDICLPHHLHAEVAIAAAEAGKHVLVEKPMACSMEQCQAMVTAAERADVILMVAQVQRYMPPIEGCGRWSSRGSWDPFGRYASTLCRTYPGVCLPTTGCSMGSLPVAGSLSRFPSTGSTSFVTSSGTYAGSRPSVALVARHTSMTPKTTRA